MATSQMLSRSPYYKRRLPGAEAAIYFLGGQPIFHYRDREGEHLKPVSMAALGEAFSGNSVDSGWLSPATVRWGTGRMGTWMVDYHPPAHYKLYIERDDGNADTLIVPLPAFIFLGLNTSYYIFSVRGRAFNSRAELYRAPLPNVDPTSGLICFGPNRHPKVQAGGMPKAWEMMWTTPYTDHHIDGKSKDRAVNKDIRPRLYTLARLRAALYPASDLVRARTHLDAQIKDICMGQISIEELP
jgi:hypothetical protein